MRRGIANRWHSLIQIAHPCTAIEARNRHSERTGSSPPRHRCTVVINNSRTLFPDDWGKIVFTNSRPHFSTLPHITLPTPDRSIEHLPRCCLMYALVSEEHGCAFPFHEPPSPLPLPLSPRLSPGFHRKSMGASTSSLAMLFASRASRCPLLRPPTIWAQSET